jgi:hypothetical protein
VAGGGENGPLRFLPVDGANLDAAGLHLPHPADVTVASTPQGRRMTLDSPDGGGEPAGPAPRQRRARRSKRALIRAENLGRILAHLDGCHAGLLAASQVEFVGDVVADEFIAERIRLALAEVAELSRLVAWKRMAEDR